MTEQNLKEKTVTGVVWSTVDRFSALGVQFIVSIVMARLLTPADYGLIGMLSIFLAVANSLIDSGFSQALIQKKNRTEVDYSTVLYFNIVVSVFLYLILFLGAPLIASFYKEPTLIPLTRVIGLSLIINSFAVVQKALFTIRVDFKTQTKASLSSSVISGIIGIIAAFRGANVWALVIQQLIAYTLNVILLWVYGKWKPLRTFSKDSFKSLFSYGSKLMLSSLINTLWTNIYSLVIGKVFNASSLGFYSRAHSFAELPSSTLTSVMQRVTFPIMCEVQDQTERFVSIFRRVMRIAAYLIFPVLMFIAGIAKPMVIVLLGERWAYSATLLTIICFAAMWYPVHAINLNPISALGRSDLFLKLEIYKKAIGIVVLVCSIPFGLEGVCYGSVISSFIMLFLNSMYTKKLINYGIIDQLKDLLPTYILAVLMFLMLRLMGLLIHDNLLLLVVDTIISFIFYIGVSKLLRLNELYELIEIATSLKEKFSNGR